MEIVTDYKNRGAWDKLVVENSTPASFLQSWQWGEFNRKILGNQVQRWAIIDEGQLQIVLTMIKKSLASGKYYWCCPRGLVWHKDYADKRINAYGQLVKKIKIELDGSVFLRISPPYEFKEYMHGFLKRLGFNKPKILGRMKEPGKTWLLDLDKPTEELLTNMHPKTRYNIKLAEKKDVKVRTMTDKTQTKDMDIFYQLSKETAERNKIKVYEKSYYEKLITFFSTHKGGVQLKLYIAEWQNKPLSAIMVLYFGDSTTYLHGGSASEGRNLMANYLVQWTSIQEARRAGLKVYDFWGISEKRKSWAGITRFKKGFGGRMVSYLGTWDYVLDKKWYNIFWLLKIIKRLIP